MPCDGAIESSVMTDNRYGIGVCSIDVGYRRIRICNITIYTVCICYSNIHVGVVNSIGRCCVRICGLAKHIPTNAASREEYDYSTNPKNESHTFWTLTD